MEWRGNWWIPTAGDDQVPGVLVQKEDGLLVLTLEGGFPGASPRTDELPEWDLVHGQCDDVPITLIEGRTISQRRRGGDILSEQGIISSRVLVGCHLDSMSQRLFGRIEFELENLYQFCSYAANWQAVDEDAERSPKHEFQHGRFSYELDLSRPKSSTRSENQGVVREDVERAVAIITADVPQSADSMLQQAGVLQDLVTFSAQKACAFLSLGLTFFAKRKQAEKVNLVINPVVSPHPNDPGSRSFLFGLRDASFEQVGKAWVEQNDTYSVPRNLLLGLLYRGNGFLESRLLTVVAAAESLHRLINPDMSGLLPDKHSMIIEALSSLDSDAKKWAEQRVERNEPSLVERLLDLHENMDPEVRATLVPKAQRWASLARRHRDETAHGLRLSGAKKSVQVYSVVAVTSAVVSMTLLAELSVPSKSILMTIRDNPTIVHASRLARTHLSTA
jgi:hypothetical protein